MLHLSLTLANALKNPQHCHFICTGCNLNKNVHVLAYMGVEGSKKIIQDLYFPGLGWTVTLFSLLDCSHVFFCHACPGWVLRPVIDMYAFKEIRYFSVKRQLQIWENVFKKTSFGSCNKLCFLYAPVLIGCVSYWLAFFIGYIKCAFKPSRHLWLATTNANSRRNYLSYLQIWL